MLALVRASNMLISSVLVGIFICCTVPLSKSYGNPQKLESGKRLFQFCQSELLIPEGPLGKEHIEKEFKRLERLFKIEYPLDVEKIDKAFGKLRKLPTGDSSYHHKLEELTLVLNQLTFNKNRPKGLAKRVISLWQAYPSAKRRSPSAMGRNEACLKTNIDKSFKAMNGELVAILKESFANQSFVNKQLKKLTSTDFLPAGSRTYFAALAQLDENNNMNICVNPEEAPPFLLPKYLHELTHAKNQELTRKKIDYNKALDDWRKAKKALDKADDELIKFNAELKSDSEIDASNVMDQAVNISYPNLEKIRLMLKTTKAIKEPYLRFHLEKGIHDHSILIMNWLYTLRKEHETSANMLKKRRNLDKSRFLDEHHAYFVSLKSALMIVKSQPEYFCRLWVPSYQQKRPIRFYQGYEHIEKHIKANSLGEWIADIYTLKSKMYLKDAIYKNGQPDAGILADLKRTSTRFSKAYYKNLFTDQSGAANK